MPVRESVHEQIVAFCFDDYLLIKAMSLERISSQPDARLEPLKVETGFETMQVLAPLHAQPR